jgi:hypothetical protein
MMILLMDLEMLRQFSDSRGHEGDLRLGGPRILFVTAVFDQDLLFLFFLYAH